MLREWKTEWMKVRYRKIGLLLAAFLALIFLWIAWAFHGNGGDQLRDGYRILFMQLPLIDTILMPTMLAMLASRLCDAEVKGDMLKLLCTLERKGRLFDMKLLMGAYYLACFLLVEIGMIFLLSMIYQFTSPLSMAQLFYFVLQIYPVSFTIFLLQVVLSFFFENQILPLAAGLFGSFVGLFSWFFADGIAKKFLLWGYYSELCFIYMDWDKESRAVTYYDMDFDVLSFGILIVVLIVGYFVGKGLFMRKEI